MAYVPIPTIVERTPRGERAWDLFSRMLQERVVLLGTPIDNEVATSIVAQLLFLQHSDPERDIWFYINSPGGIVYDALAIYDTMQFIKSPVHTYGIGVQASAAAFLLGSGEKGKRFILPNATVMIHQPSSGTRGKVTDMEIDLKEGLRLKKVLNEIMAKNTGQPLKRVEVDMERDFWMSAEEAKKYGVVDEVIKKS